MQNYKINRAEIPDDLYKKMVQEARENHNESGNPYIMSSGLMFRYFHSKRKIYLTTDYQKHYVLFSNPDDELIWSAYVLENG